MGNSASYKEVSGQGNHYGFSHFIGEDSKWLKMRILSIFKPFHPDKIIIFGSFPRGEADGYSDIDIIVVYNTDKRFLDRLAELYTAWDIPRAVDILAYTPKEFEKMLDESDFIQDAIRNGEILYEKTGTRVTALGTSSQG
jgi:uncharacterized protein